MSHEDVIFPCEFEHKPEKMKQRRLKKRYAKHLQREAQKKRVSNLRIRRYRKQLEERVTFGLGENYHIFNSTRTPSQYHIQDGPYTIIFPNWDEEKAESISIEIDGETCECMPFKYHEYDLWDYDCY
jgi:hypothetical protein